MKYKVIKPGNVMDALVLMYPQSSKNSLKKLIEHKRVYVNQELVKNATLNVFEHDLIEIKKKEEEAPMTILYQDQDIVVIDKPAGLLSMASESEKEKTAYHILRDYLKMKVFIVHRLDQDTSGVLIYAKNEKIKKALMDNWNDLVLVREYHALIEGKLDKKGTVRQYLQEDKTGKVYPTKKEGKLAITHYQPVKTSSQYSLVKVHLETGRKNQIRVAMSSLNHPIVGDKKYGSIRNPIRRLGLHASRVEVIHPFTKKKMVFVSQTPESFYSVFKG